MDGLNNERTPHIIAQEINYLVQESRRILLINAIEIGRRLLEAKEMLNHGEWLNWLKESVNYSKSTAENLMNLYKEYGPKLLSSTDDDPNSQALGNLTYTQAVLLLRLPEEEREEFILKNNVANMTSRQLNQAIKGHLGRAEENILSSSKEVPPSEKVPEDLSPLKEKLKSPAEDQLQSPIEVQNQPLPQYQGGIEIEYRVKTNKPRKTSTHNMNNQVTTSPDSSLVMSYEEKCTNCCQVIADTFQELLNALSQLSRLDPETKEKCTKDATQLASYMVERLRDWPPVAKSNIEGIRTYSTYDWSSCHSCPP